MGITDLRKVMNMRTRLEETTKQNMQKRYFKIQSIGGTWMVSTSANLMDVIQSDLTEEEADAWIRLLNEEG